MLQKKVLLLIKCLQNRVRNKFKYNVTKTVPVLLLYERFATIFYSMLFRKGFTKKTNNYLKQKCNFRII